MLSWVNAGLFSAVISWFPSSFIYCLYALGIKEDFPAYYYKICKRLMPRLMDCKPPCIMPIPLINVANIYLQMQIFIMLKLTRH